MSCAAADGTRIVPSCAALETREGLFVGTPAYASPEQAESGVVTVRSDLYSLGVVLYEMLSGRLPFTGDTPFKLMMAHLQAPVPPLPADLQLPGALVDAICTALEKRPANRFPDAATMAAALRAVGPLAASLPPNRETQLQTSRPAVPGAASTTELFVGEDATLSEERGRRPLLRWRVVAASVAAVVGLGGAWLWGRPSGNAAGVGAAQPTPPAAAVTMAPAVHLAVPPPVFASREAPSAMAPAASVPASAAAASSQPASAPPRPPTTVHPPASPKSGTSPGHLQGQKL